MYCNNCKRDIVNNSELHLIHCVRFISVCPVCDDPIAKSDFNEHQEMCVVENEDMPETPMDVENDEPVASTSEIIEVSCRFCDLNLPVDAMEEHEDYCGCRTDHCEVCGKRVILKYLDIHLSSNCTFMQLDREFSSPRFTNDVQPPSPEMVQPPFPEIVQPFLPEMVQPSPPEMVQPSSPEIVHPGFSRSTICFVILLAIAAHVIIIFLGYGSELYNL